MLAEPKNVVPNVFEEFLEKNMWKLKEPKVEGLLQKREILSEISALACVGAFSMGIYISITQASFLSTRSLSMTECGKKAQKMDSYGEDALTYPWVARCQR